MREDVFITGDIRSLIADEELTFENFFQFIAQDEQLFDLPAGIEALQPLVDQGLIQIERNRFVVIPSELSALPGAPGNFVDLDIFLPIGSFEFFEGDVDSALEMANDGPVVLLQPVIAERFGVQVGDQLPIQTAVGEIDFTVAGIGGSGWNMTIFNYPDAEAYFNVTFPSHIGVVIDENKDFDEVLTQINEIIDPIPDIAVQEFANPFDALSGIINRLTLLLNGLLMVAVVVATLGVINTIVINVTERIKEIGLLRAVGATTRQVRQTIVAEAAVLGFISAIIAGTLGFLLILLFGLLVPGITSSLGVGGKWETIRVLLRAGLRDWGIAAAVSLFFGPLVAGTAAYFPARQAATINVVEATRRESLSLKRTPTRQPSKFTTGSVRTRFVLGSAGVLFILLTGLINTVIRHERDFLIKQVESTLTILAQSQVDLLSINISDETPTLSLDILQDLQFDTSKLTTFVSLTENINELGIEEYIVTDQENVILLSLDPQEIGRLVPKLISPDSTLFKWEKNRSEWQANISIPVTNAYGNLIGSVRIQMNLVDLRDFLSQMRNTLSGIGLSIVIIGIILSWSLVSVFNQRSGLFQRFSLRTGLTAALIFIIVLVVGILGWIALPIERRQLEQKVKDTLLISAELLSQVPNEGFSIDEFSFNDFIKAGNSLETFSRLDWAKLQEFTQQAQGDAWAFGAIVDLDGIVRFSDQFSLIGEQVGGVTAVSQVEDSQWRGEEIWLVKSPILRESLSENEELEQLGSFHLGVRKSKVEDFLAESKMLFQLVGLIAILVGIIMAQWVGSVLTSPLRQLNSK